MADNAANKKKYFGKIGLFLSGAVTVIAGIVLILSWWGYLVVVFKGAVGILLALAGLVLLVMARE